MVLSVMMIGCEKSRSTSSRHAFSNKTLNRPDQWLIMWMIRGRYLTSSTIIWQRWRPRKTHLCGVESIWICANPFAGLYVFDPLNGQHDFLLVTQFDDSKLLQVFPRQLRNVIDRLVALFDEGLQVFVQSQDTQPLFQRPLVNFSV